MSPLKRRSVQSGRSTASRRSGWRTGLVGRVLVVLIFASVSLIGFGGGIASAGGFDCKDVPSPEFPNEVLETTFDSTSAERSSSGGTGYETYGWAGLKWHTYDLGCGEDLVRAPGAVGDTTLGNTFLTIGKSMAAAAFWLDDQTKTGQAAEDAGVESALGKFDQIVFAITEGMRGIYGEWLGIALILVTAMILWKALRADAAGVTKTVGIAAAGLALGALMVGAPQKALEVADDTFGSLITETQDQIFSVQFGDSSDGGTLAGGSTDPRNVLIDKIFLPDWRKGWFGTNYDPEDTAKLGPDLRDALAFTYEQQQEVKDDPKAQEKLAEEKADKFENIVEKLDSDYQLSYRQFQGKDSGRTSTGFMAMIKMSMPALLWIGASLLKLVALLSIRFAVLFSPVWIPFAIAAAGWLARILRMLGTAYMWGVAGSVIVALYLMALVQLYVNANGSVDGSWRLWFMVILTVVCWAIMRPFKRMSQTFSQNSASMVNRKARNAKKSLKHKAFNAASFAVGGPTQAIAEKAAERFARRGGRGAEDDSGDATSTSVARPEGRALNNRRQQALTQSRADARKAQGLGRAGRLGQAANTATERDARIAGIAAVASRDLARGNGAKGGVDSKDADRAVRAGASAWRILDQDEVNSQLQERKARKDLLTASVGQRWDGGDRSAIAPMKVYTPPARDKHSTSQTAPSAPRNRSTSSAPSARVWNAAAPGTTTRETPTRDRYI
ncbi:hypothetical protein [Rhodococcus sp. C3V]|uniref:hypothetical protein n=1 Tax=Rhodococcus sp. C3V TaxID=3034165 RepID=UPI0023E11734|nr:hypothetical protein [Rhodococcus sp. C3V]MDF3319886.1 hypothetical protein [Rhodococcus sp. C3V]